MAELVIRITHVSWRDGRPRFQPSARLRAEGWKGEDLRHGPLLARPGHPPQPTGPWFTPEEALAWITEREKAIVARRAEIAAAKSAKKRVPAIAESRAAPAPPAGWITVGGLFEAWFASPRLAGEEVSVGRRTGRAVAAATRRDYEIKAGVLEAFDPEIWSAAVDALTRPIVYDLYERLWAKRGLATARGVVAVLSAAISWGQKKGRVKLEVNPCARLGMETPPPRLRALSPAEVRALVAAADAVGRPEIGDAVTLGVWTGQRQADRLAMIEAGAVDGRRLFRQAKTGSVVMIPDAPELAVRLAAARRRRADWRVEPVEIVVDERARAPFRREHYAHTFAAVRAAAVAGVTDPESGAVLVAPCPSLADARDQDLRDTAVTWLARAGCTLPEICQITGHSMTSAQTVLRHYLAGHPEMADNAIRKLVAWMEGQR